MKKSVIGGIILGMFFMSNGVQATEISKIDRLLELQPGLSQSELLVSIDETARTMNISREEVIEISLSELESAIEDTEKEMRQLRGGSSGNKKLGTALNKGDIFYTPSSTLGIPHGHVGIYYAFNRIVESIPETGVRNISYVGRNVEPNAVMQSVSTTQAKRNAAANWANSRVGIDGYSYNFATNRQTAHTGAKNCSKLVWSAYLLNAGTDIDRNGGTGVYPLDIRDSNLTRTYQTIR
ncbi:MULTISPECIES: hypothetical protein [Enterococcus]|uniref:YycO n=1 Tax=Enterococcus faecium EnGen0003 TaxID=1138901 RepID=A0A828ZL57_ENTFC|nr:MULTISPECIES: hypothetical protein [Enterococcus]AYA33269.1 hypothetical protein CTI32_02000 [Enterococcus faecium]EEV51037.1 conserved hypothetical protein [Enterococcus faecium 1,141,733]EGP5003991.1 hypothetical protein [Enterococcus faecium]EGP5048950.1 hypothetical protein [Enterococcus faecium]EGP5072745.1 hypothetical protein [Enterococcus faecium]